MSSRIEAKFGELRKAGRKGLVGYLTAGDPDFKKSTASIISAIKAGVDVLELGVPFSDPTADGPEIQAAAHRALKAGMNLGRALEMVKLIRRESDVPVILFGYANPFFKYGYSRLCKEAAAAGVDGLLIVDMPFEEAAEIRGEMDRHGLEFITLVAPTTPAARARMILKDAGGFVYYIMVTGVTGARTSVATGLRAKVAALRKCTKLPVAVGFGVSNGKQAAEAARGADAVVVGSALVKAAKEGRLTALVREIRTALDRK